MKVLNLTADTPELQRIKDYLQENASDVLADKINNGTPFEKDGKSLINKKTLSGFMTYAAEEARKIAEKNARYACVEDKTVFGWAIHYFEEDTIEGNLYYMDGAEYKLVPKPKTTTITPNKVEPPKKESMQFSLFDVLEEVPTNNKSDNTDTELENAIKGQVVTEDGEIIDYEDFDGNTDDEPEEDVSVVTTPLQEPQGTPLYLRYKSIQDAYPDSVIAMRLGDFYEVFGELATTIANELELTLTGRDCGLASRVPMCGFPYHCADKYFGIIHNKHNLIVVPSSDDKDNIYYPKTDKKPDNSTKPNNPNITKLKALFGADLEVII